MATKSLPLDVSSKLVSKDGLSLSSLSVSTYGNNTATAEKASVLISVKAEGEVSAEQFAGLMVENSAGGTEAEARLFINAFDAVIAELAAKYGAVTIKTPFGTIETFVDGSLENAQDEIDPAENQAFLAIIPPESYRREIANIEAYVPTAACPASLRYLRDSLTGNNAIYGTRMAHLHCRKVTLGGTGESAALYSLLGTKVCDLIVDAQTKSTASIPFTLPATQAIPAGRYVIKVVTSAGAGSVGSTLWPLSIEVNLAEGVVPVPTITKVKEGTRTDDTVGFSSSNQYVISGLFPEGWKTTDQLIVRSLRDGAVYATMVANEFVNASASDTTKIVLSKLENLSAEPDSEWNNHPAEFVFKRGDVEYKHTVSWMNA